MPAHVARKCQRHVTLGVSAAADRVIEHFLRRHVSRALYDVNRTLQREGVLRIVERAAIGIDGRIGLHVVNVSGRLVNFCGAVDLRLIGSERRWARRLRLRAVALEAAEAVALGIVHHDVAVEKEDLFLVVAVGTIGRDVSPGASHHDLRRCVEVAALEVGVDRTGVHGPHPKIEGRRRGAWRYSRRRRWPPARGRLRYARPR